MNNHHTFVIYCHLTSRASFNISWYLANDSSLRASICCEIKKKEDEDEVNRCEMIL